MKLARAAKVFAVSGLVGWGIENFLGGPRYSSAFDERYRLPLLPVYGAGGLAIAMLEPKIFHLSLLARAGVYALALTGIEYVACKLDSGHLWNYTQDQDSQGNPIVSVSVNTEGCVDLPHSLAWTALALLAEPALAGGK